MKNWLLLLAVIASKAAAVPDIVAPFIVDVIDSVSSRIFDRIQITTYAQNRGTMSTSSHSFDATIVSVGVDSFHVKDHKVLAFNQLQPNRFYEFKCSTLVFKGTFSVNTQADPLQALGQGGGQTLNDVRSAGFNFHPRVIRDTVVLYDTLVIRDTLKIVEKDTVIITLRDTIRVTVRDTIIKKDTIRVTVRDTVIRVDTIKYCPPTLAKAGRFDRGPAVSSVVYNAIGQPVWRGALRPGEYPPVRLKQGLHMLVQGDRVHRFRVAYK